MIHQFAIAQITTPMLSTDSWETVFSKENLPLEKETGLLRYIEGIAFAGTVFQVLEEKKQVFLASSDDYPSKVWVDKRFVSFSQKTESPQKKAMPPPEQILAFIEKRAQENTLYLWGGNFYKGIPELLDFYPPINVPSKDSLEYKLRTLQGLDCSGLLYEATEGCSFRNTSQLLNFGSPIAIEGRTVEGILQILRPLDLLIWKGHIVIVFDGSYCIESKHPHGVIMTKTKERLEEIFTSRSPKDAWEDGNYFVLRRFI